MVRALLAASDPQTGQPLSDAEICNELVLFMLAGHDTTSTTLSYALWALGHHRDLQDLVAAEVGELGDRNADLEDVPRLGYTIQVLHEALRLCPPGGTIGRLAMQDIEVDGDKVEAGTLAVVGIYAIHRDPALWDNPLVFDPDRFSAQRSASRTRWQYLPFGGGRARASGITSPCWRQPWRWPRSFARSRSILLATISPATLRSPLSPPSRFGPAYESASDISGPREGVRQRRSSALLVRVDGADSLGHRSASSVISLRETRRASEFFPSE